MSRVYEVVFIVRPDVAEEEVDKLIAGFSTTVTGGGGVVKTVEKMGRRKLAYMVRKFNDGNYVLLVIQAEGGLVATTADALSGLRDARIAVLRSRLRRRSRRLRLPGPQESELRIGRNQLPQCGSSGSR